MTVQAKAVSIASRSNGAALALHEPVNGRASMSNSTAFLQGGGEMGRRMRAFDWASTPLGLPEDWPQSLRAAVSLCLGSRFPIVIWWGREKTIQLYNDGYISFLGPAKHPAFLGRSGRECWTEIWETMGPLWDKVFDTGEATWSEDFLYAIDRKLPREEGYFTFSYSPIRGDSQEVEGIFCACYETTGKVVGARRLETLRKLGEQAMEADSVADACERPATVLSENPYDIAFARIYCLDANGKLPPNAIAPEALASVLLSRQPLDLGGLEFPGGAWPEPATQAVVLPLFSSSHEALAGLIALGVSPRRPLDPEYRTFFNLIAGHVSTAIANARVREEERKRAEALAELDRAKTIFFSNVSHEFRTPLTLMLGPLEELLSRNAAEVSDSAKVQLKVAQRNSLRLLRLVNTLLDFSRLEAGRVRARFEPTDLGAFTATLASVFRAATQRAGLKLRVDCPSLEEPVYVDREMWEKIVFNLLSNALKFTLKGEIEVTLQPTLEGVQLSVRDTGVGIPAEEMPRLFDRFHRIPNAHARTTEGSGIGLALVHELAKLHGGSVQAESRLGHGTTFKVSLPAGRAHLPPERIGEGISAATAGTTAAPFVEEALRWLPDIDSTDGEAIAGVPRHTRTDQRGRTDEDRSRPTVLVADDNADMRGYVTRLLAKRYNVEAVPDGAAALKAARHQRPDLVLSDIMMPGLDGIGLVRELRADVTLKTIPIILLSARAGEESRVEGLEHGADDYLVKPFSARELMARVSAHLEMARVRREAEVSLRESREVLTRNNAELERLVDERTAKLTEMVSELQQVSYAMVHDMRAPLRAMSGFAGSLKEICADRLRPNEIRRSCDRIIAGANRLDRLITDALCYTKSVLTEGASKRVDLGKLLREILDTYPNLCAEKADIFVTGELPAVMGAESLLTQVFSNLLGNAVKFVAPGVRPRVRVWAEISYETPDPKSDIDVKNGGHSQSALANSKAGNDQVRIWVEDNGIGIPKNAQARLFGIFQKLDSAYEGTGIGLAVVRKVTQRMGGRVGAESEPGKGSRFWVELPLAEKQPA